MGLIEKVTMEQDEREEMHGRSGNAGTAFQGEGTHCKDPEADVYLAYSNEPPENLVGCLEQRGECGRR